MTPDVKCRFCKADIFFMRTPSRRLMPLDADAAFAREVPAASRWSVDEQELRCWPTPEADDSDVIFVPHWSVCPSRQRHEPRNGELMRRWKTNQGRAED